MTTVISRPPIDHDLAQESIAFLTEAVTEKRAWVRESAEDLWDLMTTARSLAEWRSTLDPTGNEIGTWAAVVLALQAGAAHLQLATAPPGTVVTARIGDQQQDETLSWTARPGMVFADAGTWCDVLALATACRDAERTTALCAIDTDRLRSPGIDTPAYLLTWVQAWQALWQGRPDTADLLLRVHEQLHDHDNPVPDQDGHRHAHGHADYLNRIFRPQLDLFQHYLLQDSAQFQQALTDALYQHGEYWSEQDRVGDPAGFIAWGPLALAALATENGWALEVESDYLPAHLANGGWAGEYPT